MEVHTDARRDNSAGDVYGNYLGPEGAQEPSHPTHLSTGRASVQATLSGLRRDVRRHRPSFGPTGAPAQGGPPDDLYSARSERQFCERLEYDLLFKWFLDLNLEDPAFDATTSSKNRGRLLEHDVAGRFMQAVLEEAHRRSLLSEEHFTVHGTLLEAWASLKSFRPKDEQDPSAGGGRNPERAFHVECRLNDTHASTTDGEARLYKKGSGQAAKLSYMAHVLMENRSGLPLDILVTQAIGTAERDGAITMFKRRRGTHRRATLGADKAYDARDFVNRCRELDVTPHVARNQRWPEGPRLMAASPVTRGTPRANASGNWPKRVSAG